MEGELSLCVFVYEKKRHCRGDIKMASSKKKGPVEKIALQCTECKQKNYTTQKNRRNTPGKLELMKYCPFEHKHTLHRETKIK